MPASSRPRQLRLAEAGDVARDFLRAELGVARDHRQLLDVDRRVAIVGNHALGDQDRVLVVVAVPRHERDQHVLAERQLAHVGRRTVGDHVAQSDDVADADQRPLVDVGILVAARVFRQVVDVHADVAGRGFGIVDPHDDPVGVDVIDLAAAARLHRGARVDGRRALDPGAHERLLRAQAGHRLPLHVRAHQRAVGVVVLEERDQRRGHRHDLRRRDVHVVDLVRGSQHELVLAAAGHELVFQAPHLVQLRVRLRDHVLTFLDGRQVVDLVGDLALHHLAVGRLEEAVLVGSGVQRERVDEADVRAFGRLDRAHSAVVGRVHVAHLEAGALAGEAPGTERRNAPLVGDLGERVRLIHELRQLRRSEEFLDRGRDRLGVDEVVRQQVLALGLAEALLHRALHAHEPRAELILGELAHRAHAPVAQVVDVVDLAAAVAQLDQDLDDGDDVVVGERRGALQLAAPDAAIELHPADRREVVALLGEEQAVEQRLDGVLGRRLAGAHHPIDRHAGSRLVRRLVGTQRL